MILSHKSREYFKLIGGKVTQGMAQYSGRTPYWLEGDSVIRNYEVIRKVWFEGISLKSVCGKFNLSRSSYYDVEESFIKYGAIGIFPEIKTFKFAPDLERLILMVVEARPSLSQQAMLRIAEALPITRQEADLELITNILSSYGRSCSNQVNDRSFWDHIQRYINELHRLKKQSAMGRRDKKQRKKTFFQDADIIHKRLEMMRELFFDPSAPIKKVCMEYGVTPISHYRLKKDYLSFGPWAVIPAQQPGKESMNRETELATILHKLRHPNWSAQQIVKVLKLRCSRFTVNRIFSRWGISDKKRPPIALDHYCEPAPKEESFTAKTSAYHIHPDLSLLESRRVNRDFELICKKMETHSYHLCDPGPLLLAPFLNDLGIVQAMESYGPPRLRGKDLTNLGLLNVFRILSGYRRINQLSNNRDRSVAIASGLSLFGTRSRYYQDTLEYKFDQIHSLRCDLVTRAKELSIIEGTKIAFDFHFTEFYGSNSKEKGIGKGPDKSGDIVPGFRPHVAWDLAANTILSITYYHGGVRAPGIIEQYCEQHIFPLIDPKAIQEIYMDSEYTKESSLQYFKQIQCPNGDVYICLRKNKQIKKLIAPALETEDGWEDRDSEDNIKSIQVVLPKTGLPLKIVILKDIKTGKNIRCFGSTKADISGDDLLKKYRYRWLIENGLKDLVYSYYIDEMYGNDPEKIEFEFYCVMVARLAYEYFLKELGGEHFYHKDGNKTTLQTMRNMLFEKRNYSLEQDSKGNFVVTLLDSDGNALEKEVANMLDEKLKNGSNKVLWWGNRGIILRFANQYNDEKCPPTRP